MTDGSTTAGPAGTGPAATDDPRGKRDPRRSALRPVGGVALALAVAAVVGVVLGLVWESLSPRVPLLATADSGLVLDEPGGAVAFDATGVLTLLAAGVGLVAGGLGVRAVRRAADTPAAVLVTVLAAGLPAGAVALAAVVGRAVGTGPSQAQVAAVPPGGHIDAALALGSWVVVAVAPLAALVVVAVFSLWPAAGRRPGDDRRHRADRRRAPGRRSVDRHGSDRHGGGSASAAATSSRAERA